MSQLSALRPEWRAEYVDQHLTADNSGHATGHYFLTFVCPKCGPPHVIHIKIGAEMNQDDHRWQASPMPDGVDWPSRVTITPSINNTNRGHGRRAPVCSFHGNITNGEVVPP